MDDSYSIKLKWTGMTLRCLTRIWEYLVSVLNRKQARLTKVLYALTQSFQVNVTILY